jgi:hypothetical protein
MIPHDLEKLKREGILARGQNHDGTNELLTRRFINPAIGELTQLIADGDKEIAALSQVSTTASSFKPLLRCLRSLRET